MTLFKYYDRNKLPMPDEKILATDIDTNVLNEAIEGVYNTDKFEGIDPQILKKYFLKGKGENSREFKIKDYIKNKIYFRRLNLLDERYPMKNQFDMIFCRNVIIYFDNETRIKVFKKFHNYLRDDGYFFAGHSENLSSFTNIFKLVGNTIYTKA